MSIEKAVFSMDGRESTWAKAISQEAGIRVSSCYQCLRCTNSCPVSTFMDVKPHQAVRLVQLGRRERLLACSAIWICLSCEMCSTYCPNEIDVAALMNHLKNSVAATGRKPAELGIALFHEVFLDVLTRNGRINDLQLMQLYRWKTMSHGKLPPLKELGREMSLALELFKRHRIKVLPERSPAAAEIRSLVRTYGRKGITS